MAENHECHGLIGLGNVCGLPSVHRKSPTQTHKKLLDNLVAAKIVTVNREAVYVERIDRVVENHRYILRLCDDLYKD